MKGAGARKATPPVEPATIWCEYERKFPPAVRARILQAANWCCQVCGAEDNRSVLRRFTQWDQPDAWIEFSGTATRTWDDYLVIVHLIVWTEHAVVGGRA
jgi:hypothetical protein